MVRNQANVYAPPPSQTSTELGTSIDVCTDDLQNLGKSSLDSLIR
jgi:hypothetical protein